MRRILGPARLAAIATLALLALGGGSATAAPAQCGEVITQDTTLDSDLVDCFPVGLEIGADDIKLNLDGHTIDGIGTSFGAGVDISSHHGVTVTGGTIRDIGAGVQMALLGDADHNTVQGVSITDVGMGVVLFGNADDNVIQGNSIVSARNLGVLVRPGLGSVEKPERNIIVRNTITGGGNGIGVFESLESVIERNTVTGSGSAGILTGLGATATIRRNDVLQGKADGIFIEAGTIVALSKNTSSFNGDDGLDIESTGASVEKNRANGNLDLGIEAVPGVTDGGGNKASGNGDSAQCLNVSCKTKGKPKK